MKSKTLARYYYIGAVALAVLAAVIHTVVYLNFYDFSSRLWQRGTSPFWGAVSYLLLIPVVALAILFANALMKAKGEGECEASPFHPSLFTKVMLFVLIGLFGMTLVAQVLASGTADKLNALIDSSLGNLQYMALTAALHTFTLLLAIPAAFYFISHLRGSGYKVAFGIVVILYFVCYTLRVYFDMTMHINNPRWSFRVVVLIAVLLYFVLEVHQLIAREKTVLFCTVSFAAMMLALAEATSAIVMAIGFYSNEGYEIVYSVLLLAVALYIASRLYAMLAEEKAETVPAEKSEDKTDSEMGTDTVDEGDSKTDTDTVDESDSESEEAQDDGFEELTQDELKRFYTAVYQTVANKRGLTENASEEEKAQVREETMAVISHLLDGDSRRENIAHMRAFLSRVEGRDE